jgi:hypothetical protein
LTPAAPAAAERTALALHSPASRQTKRRKIFIFLFWAHPAAPDRAFRLYLFCLRQKRIPLQSLARSVVGNFIAIYFTAKSKKYKNEEPL